MRVVSLVLFFLWVLFRMASGQEIATAEKAPSERIVEAALFRATQDIRYDPAYVSLEYPGGDVPANTGVCTDVVIRTYRAALGIDLQKLVHEDMRNNFSEYPKLWGLNTTDRNIDHRRVPNLQKFFERRGASLPLSNNPDFLPGDLVAWDLNGNGLWHIGVVVDDDTFVHNIGAGPEITRGIRQWKIVGHYRYHPEAAAEN